MTWWSEHDATASNTGLTADRRLYDRLARSSESPPERLLFRAYCARYGEPNADAAPALIRQVYLHYDPYTARELTAMSGGELVRQRMDLLLLLSDRQRIVIDVDGKHHYADGDRAAPQRYAEMVAEDRRIRLAGYEVYRFGGWELTQPNASQTVERFFAELLDAEH